MATERKIDLSETADLTPYRKKVRLNRIARGVEAEWRRQAATLPPKYRGAYVRSMSVQVKDHSIVMALDSDDSVGSDGVMARSVEYGYGPGGIGTTGPYDMRKTLLRSRSVKFGKRGRYLNVPMRVTRRGMDKMGGRASYTAAKALRPTMVRGKQTISWGSRLSNPSGFAERIHPVARYVPGVGTVPAHATDPLANLYKFNSAGQRGASYGIFRTISEAGKPWIHPGIPAHRLIRKVVRRMSGIIAETRR